MAQKGVAPDEQAAQSAATPVPSRDSRAPQAPASPRTEAQECPICLESLTETGTTMLTIVVIAQEDRDPQADETFEALRELAGDAFLQIMRTTHSSAGASGSAQPMQVADSLSTSSSRRVPPGGTLTSTVSTSRDSSTSPASAASLVRLIWKRSSYCSEVSAA